MFRRSILLALRARGEQFSLSIRDYKPKVATVINVSCYISTRGYTEHGYYN